MEIEIDFSGLEQQFDEKEIKKKIKRSMETMALEWEAEAKRIISDAGKVDVGQFINSIHYEMFDEEEIGFTGYDGVSYGKFHEYGVLKHWVPFFYYGDTSKPILADWGRRVLNLDDETMLAMGGLEVELDELMPFRKALLSVEGKTREIFEKEFKK